MSTDPVNCVSGARPSDYEFGFRLLRASAFSLIEVLLATGLVTFSALVIFSLLPVGLASMQEANRQIIETEVFSTVGAELAATPFDKLTNYQATRFPVYFNNEGIEVGSVADAIFTVRCAAPVAEPGGELNRVSVSIGFRRDPAQTNGSGKISKRTFFLVNRMGQTGTN
jgi:uncharacterized protein (TIGR02598 family)